MLNVAIDIDGVVKEWQHHWADLYDQWFDETIRYDLDGFDDAANLDGDGAFDVSWKLREWDACLKYTRFDTMNEFYDWYHEADGWNTQPYVPGAQGALWDLLQMSDKVRFKFVTSRPAEGRRAALDLAARWGTKALFLPSADKWRAEGIDLWVDDAPEVLNACWDHGKNIIRFVRPWNRDAAGLGANNWAEVLDMIRKEAGL